MESKPTKEILKEWHNDRSNWILGIFYFNKKDKRLLPPKRIEGLGWTINFANLYSVSLLTAIIILTIITISVLIKR